MHAFLSYRQKLIAAAVILLAVFFILPSSFVVESAGPALDVNGTLAGSMGGDGGGAHSAEVSLGTDGTAEKGDASDSGTSLVSISGVPTYPTDSHFFLTTVSAWGTPDAGASGLQALKALFDPHDQLYPLQALYPQGLSAEEVQQFDEQEMEYSQESAAAAALAVAGHEVKEKLTVAALDPAYPSGEVLREGDVIIGMRLSAEEDISGEGSGGDGEGGDIFGDGGGELELGLGEAGSFAAPYTSVTNFMDISEFLENVEPGTSIDVQVKREGEIQEVSFPTGEPTPDMTGWRQPGSVAGVSLEVSDVQLSADIEYAIEDIGGPSAGMMFALGIYDQLTEGSLAGDARIAGTGTIAWNGRIGPIGGIEHKMRGATSKGIQNFLAPAENCLETSGHTPQGMKVWAVRTLDDAIAAAQAIGSGDTDKLSSLTPCSAIRAVE